MKYGNRATLETLPRKTIEVEVAEADACFRLREMSGTERDKFEVGVFKDGIDGKRTVDPLYLRARLVALCLVGEGNVRLYADEEVHQLSDNVPASVIGKLFAAAQQLNGLDADAVEAAAKNSVSVPAGASTSDSL
jgi:hypothetical protein